MVARALDGKWMNLFRPERVPDVAGIKTANSDSLIDTGFFQAERLVKISSAAPLPSGAQRDVFAGHEMGGIPLQAAAGYAVEIAKSACRQISA